MAKGGRRNHSGRKRKPTAMKVVQGTFRGDRHAKEVQVESKWPEPPPHLNPRERALWDALEKEAAPWVAPCDWMALNGVVSLMDRVLEIQAAMRATPEAANPLTITFTPSADGEPNAEPAPNPLYGMELKFWTGLRSFIAITGLSPADRSRVQKPAAEPKTANPLDRFLKKA